MLLAAVIWAESYVEEKSSGCPAGIGAADLRLISLSLCVILSSLSLSVYVFLSSLALWRLCLSAMCIHGVFVRLSFRMCVSVM